VKAVVTIAGSVEIREVPEPQPATDVVVVQVHSAGICGSDVHGVESGRMPAGRTLGHELAGTVVATAAGASEWATGSAVAVNPIGSCQQCAACYAGVPFRCEVIPNVGLGAPGGFAQYLSVPIRQLHRLPSSLDPELGARVEPLAVALRSVALAEVTPGEPAVVFGIGTVGLHVIIALQAAGASPIVAVGRSPARRAAAARLGVEHVLDASSTSLTTFADELGIRFRHAFECSGAAGAIDQLLPTLDYGGTIVEVGLVTEPTPISLMALVHKQASLVGSCAFDDEE